MVKGAEDKRDEALRIFYWIRDNIKFGISNIDARASRTLKKGYGECGNKIKFPLMQAIFGVNAI
ncbi:MAG: transglutaminase domain-containing protein [Candidatus Heimdallarchaeaceae archaeon]